MRFQEQGPVGRYKGPVIGTKPSGNHIFCLPRMVTKTDNMPQMQGGHHEKHKDYTSDQGRALEKSVNPMEMDDIHTRSIKRSGTLIGTDRESYALKERKAMDLDHLHPPQYHIFYITLQKSDQKKKTGLPISKNP